MCNSLSRLVESKSKFAIMTNRYLDCEHVLNRMDILVKKLVSLSLAKEIFWVFRLFICVDDVIARKAKIGINLLELSKYFPPNFFRDILPIFLRQGREEGNF